MTNGIDIFNIGREEFFARDKETREWLLFSAVTGLNRRLNETEKRRNARAAITAAFSVFVGGFMAVVTKAAVWK